MDTTALRRSRRITQRLLPIVLAVYLTVAGLWARPGLLHLHDRTTTLAGFLVAALAMLWRAAAPSSRSMIWGTCLVLVVLLARAWAIGVDGLGYRPGDRIVGVTGWLAWSYVVLHLGLTGLASISLARAHDPEPPSW